MLSEDEKNDIFNNIHNDLGYILDILKTSICGWKKGGKNEKCIKQN